MKWSNAGDELVLPLVVVGVAVVGVAVVGVAVVGVAVAGVAVGGSKPESFQGIKLYPFYLNL